MVLVTTSFVQSSCSSPPFVLREILPSIVSSVVLSLQIMLSTLFGISEIILSMLAFNVKYLVLFSQYTIEIMLITSTLAFSNCHDSSILRSSTIIISYTMKLHAIIV